MKYKRVIAVLAPLLVLASTQALAQASANDGEYRFAASVDGSRLGSHRFEIRTDGGQRRVTSEANFQVSVFFVTAYEYKHRNRETWRNGCLATMEAKTDDNGDKSEVSAAPLSPPVAGVRVTTRAESEEAAKDYQGCLGSFAYWDLEFLRKAKRVLNAQTGEVVEARLVEQGTERISTKDGEIDARRYLLRAGEATIALWYDRQERWIKLASTLDSGKTLTYDRE